MPISVQCKCGKTLKVDEKHRGKKAKCPACGNVLVVEEKEAEAKTAVQAKEPKKKKSASKSDDDNPDDAPEDRKPIKRKKEKQKSNSKLLESERIVLSRFGRLNPCFIESCSDRLSKSAHPIHRRRIRVF